MDSAFPTWSCTGAARVRMTSKRGTNSSQATPSGSMCTIVYLHVVTSSVRYQNTCTHALANGILEGKPCSADITIEKMLLDSIHLNIQS